MNRRLWQPGSCENMHHRGTNAPIRCCPQCGNVVNAAIRAHTCNESQHAAARRHQSVFCVHCGTQLIVSR
jgi:hypothetical protein